MLTPAGRPVGLGWLGLKPLTPARRRAHSPASDGHCALLPLVSAAGPDADLAQAPRRCSRRPRRPAEQGTTEADRRRGAVFPSGSGWDARARAADAGQAHRRRWLERWPGDDRPATAGWLAWYGRGGRGCRHARRRTRSIGRRRPSAPWSTTAQVVDDAGRAPSSCSQRQGADGRATPTGRAGSLHDGPSCPTLGRAPSDALAPAVEAAPLGPARPAPAALVAYDGACAGKRSRRQPPAAPARACCLGHPELDRARAPAGGGRRFAVGRQGLGRGGRLRRRNRSSSRARQRQRGWRRLGCRFCRLRLLDT